MEARDVTCPWKLWAVEIDGAIEVFPALTRSKARYMAACAWPGTETFVDLLPIMHVRRFRGPYEGAEYDYVRRFYGLDVKHGDPVTFRGEPSLEGERGWVLLPIIGRGSSVHVGFADGRRCYVHALNVIKENDHGDRGAELG